MSHAGFREGGGKVGAWREEEGRWGEEGWEVGGRRGGEMGGGGREGGVFA